MEWNQEVVGGIIQTARLAQGLSLETVGELAGVKPAAVSALERGLRPYPPHRATQAKIEKALGVELPIPRGAPLKVSTYIPAREECFLIEAMTKFPGKSRSAALMLALKAWSASEAALKKWKDEHGGQI